MDIRAHNRIAWDKNVAWGENRWTIPVSPEAVAAARQGRWEIYLTPTRPVPEAWFPALPGCNVLCLASGGGQQGPILAAAGANVTVFDNSPKQLAQDRMVAERESLDIVTVEGDMRDLSEFPGESFDLIVHPVSNLFVPDVRPVWAESFRVLRPGGALLAGYNNPARYLFDWELYEQGILEVKHALPYSDAARLSEEEKRRYLEGGEFLEFSHTLEDQIGDQIEAGFLLAGLYEDYDREDDNDALSKYMPVYVVTRAVKL
ncbi:MAG: SAM-dependent methyltransferase [Anaerolineaceae bacterium 4572_32.2]|nr:MAG: SAM-dependent methyltransferase [Anaerolineaceae bacterium 4572_32.2]HEY74503.1 class I SAM-dependent methyltransferase [Thermoflexia bacterium]